MAAERELKLGGSPGFHLPQLDGAVEGLAAGPVVEKRLETVYHDTEELSLARWGVSLRHRAGEGWTLKLPGSSEGGVLEREELEFPGPPSRPPAAALSVVAAYLRGRPVAPVARLSTWRRKVDLLLGGQKVADVVDDEVSVLDGRRVALRFRELEVEVRPQAPDGLLDAVARRLQDAGAGVPDATPKHLRALGPRAQQPPEVAPLPLGPDPTAGDAARAAFAGAVQNLLRHDPALRVGTEPEDVHQARVAVRRLRSDLRTFEPILDAGWSRGFAEGLRWLGDQLGTVRDLEVQAGRMAATARRLPPEDRAAGARMAAVRQAEAEAARRGLRGVLDSSRYLDLVGSLVAAVAEPELAGDFEQRAGAVLPKLAARQFDRLRKAARSTGKGAPDAQLHHVRILAKRARYAAEAAERAGIAAAGPLARDLARLQTVLGEHQDAVTARTWLRSAGAAGRRGFAAGQMYMLEDVAAAAARAQWRDAWRRARRARNRGWLDA